MSNPDIKTETALSDTFVAPAAKRIIGLDSADMSGYYPGSAVRNEETKPAAAAPAAAPAPKAL